MADPAALGGAGPRRDERKLVTVLLAEIEEAVESWSEPDPEDVNQAMAGHAARVRDQVRRFGGVVEQLVGGRTLAVFGLPRTREDDRCARCGRRWRSATSSAGRPAPWGRGWSW
jgi:class 3 adenylate cyclase